MGNRPWLDTRVLIDALADAFGESRGAVTPETYRSVGGGSINEAYRLTLRGGREVFLKSHRSPPPGMFAAERAGLEALRATNTICVPEVYAHHDPEPGSGDPGFGAAGFLVMEALELGRTTPHSEALLGERLAALHRCTSDRADPPRYGFAGDNFIGATPQPNPRTASWIAFFREHRLEFQRKLLIENGHQGLERDLGLLIDSLDWALIEPDEGPALIHGDLWSGNRLTLASGEPAIIDPAAYDGHREAELAMMTLFGRPTSRFFEAYDAAFRREPGHERREAVYQLYHVLNHANLFGSGYLGQARALLTRILG